MADETKGQGAASNPPGNTPPPATPSPQQPTADEPRILEEVITHVAAKPQEKPAPTPATPAPPPTPKPTLPAPPPVPKQPPPVPAAPTVAKEEPSPAPPPIRSVVPPAPAPTPAPATPPSPPQTPVTPEQKAEVNMQADIANILKGVKLPERRDVKASGDARVIEQKPIEAVLAAEPVLQETPPAKPQTEEKGSIVAVHTLKDDLQHVVRDQKVSLVRAASLEQERKYRKEAQETAAPSAGAVQRSRRTAGILFATLLLLLLGGAALWGVYAVETARSSASTPKIDQSSILFAENSVAFPISGHSSQELKQTLAQARNTSGTLGSITRIVPVIAATSSDGTSATRPATFVEFMTALGANPPDDLVRALGSDFFFGIHTVDKNTPILIIPVVAYDRAFAGMLAWEPTMNSDLAPVFTAVPQFTNDPQGLPVKRTFTDLVMKNYDVRGLKDDAGRIELYYSFPTQSLLVIAESPYSFTEVLSRLQAEGKL